jgi:choline dehydrogenase-like flavoprotein
VQERDPPDASCRGTLGLSSVTRQQRDVRWRWRAGAHHSSATTVSLVTPVIRVRVEMMGSPKCRIVGKSQSVHMMINPIIFTRTRRRLPSKFVDFSPRSGALLPLEPTCPPLSAASTTNVSCQIDSD